MATLPLYTPPSYTYFEVALFLPLGVLVGVAAALSAAKATGGSSGASDVVVSDSVPLTTGAASCS